MNKFKEGDRVQIWDTEWQREGDTLGTVDHVYPGGWEIDVTCDTRPGEVFAVFASNLDRENP